MLDGTVELRRLIHLYVERVAQTSRRVEAKPGRHRPEAGAREPVL